VLSDGSGNPWIHVKSDGNITTTAGQIRAKGDNGIAVFASEQSITVANGATLNLSSGSAAQIICIGCASNGQGGAFFANYNTTVSQIGGSTAGISTSDSGTVAIAVYKSTSSNTVTFKNRSGGSLIYRVSMFCGENGNQS